MSVEDWRRRHCAKTVLTDAGPAEISVPRDGDASSEPKIGAKGQPAGSGEQYRYSRLPIRFGAGDSYGNRPAIGGICAASCVHVRGAIVRSSETADLRAEAGVVADADVPLRAEQAAGHAQMRPGVGLAD
jgi:hypothetical protein